MIERLEVERFRRVSSRPFGMILGAINARIAHPKMAELFPAIQQADSVGKMEK